MVLDTTVSLPLIIYLNEQSIITRETRDQQMKRKCTFLTQRAVAYFCFHQQEYFTEYPATDLHVNTIYCCLFRSLNDAATRRQ